MMTYQNNIETNLQGLQLVKSGIIFDHQITIAVTYSTVDKTEIHKSSGYKMYKHIHQQTNE